MGNTSCADANRVATLRTRALLSGESTYGYRFRRHERCPFRSYRGISKKTVTALLRHVLLNEMHVHAANFVSE
jgi:hypothetical protein